jgi:hypothetical protein
MISLFWDVKYSGDTPIILLGYVSSLFLTGS